MHSGNVVLKEKNGSYPIHVAVQLNSIDCVMVLIHIGVDINKTNALGFTPLQLAKSSGHVGIPVFTKRHYRHNRSCKSPVLQISLSSNSRSPDLQHFSLFSSFLFTFTSAKAFNLI
jgi:hypothetical protein